MKQKIPVFFSCLSNAFELAEPEETAKPKPIKAKFGLDDLGQRSAPKPSGKFRRTISNASGDTKSLFQKLSMFINIKKLTNHMVKMLELGANPEMMKREIGEFD